MPVLGLIRMLIIIDGLELFLKHSFFFSDYEGGLKSGCSRSDTKYPGGCAPLLIVKL